MKHKILVPVLIIVLLLASVAPAWSQSISDASYSLYVDGSPMPQTMTVQPGQDLAIGAIAHLTYHGQSLSPHVVVHTEIYLSQGGQVLDTQAEDIDMGQIALSDGQTYSPSGTVHYIVPTTVAGPCMLKLVASADAQVQVLGQTVASAHQDPETAVLILNVVPPVSSGTAAVTPIPEPAPVPDTLTTYYVDQGSIETDGGQKTFETGELKTTVADGQGGQATVAASVDVRLGDGQIDGQLNVYLQSAPDATAATQFMLAAANAGEDIRDIACVLVVDKVNLANGQEVQGATIRMKVSRAWVNANGGRDAIRILRYSDGVAEALDTQYVGMDGDLMVFEALSPHGLSQFALAALSALPVSAIETTSAAGGSGASINYGLIVGGAISGLVALLLVVGGVYITLKKRKANKQ